MPTQVQTRVGGALLLALSKDPLLLILLLVFAGLANSGDGAIQTAPALVDWPTVAALAGLLVLTKGVELSGYLHRLGERVITAMHSERALALCLVLVSTALATLLTNDVALFIVVPLTLSLHGLAALPVTRLVIFEALAVNAGSTLTPIGNPQNLFLWQISHTAFHQFVAAMLPLTVLLMLPLLLLTVCAFPRRPVTLHEEMQLPPLQRRLLWLSLALYPPFLLLTDLHQAAIALLILLVIYAWRERAVLVRVDWALVAVFILMFIDLRLLARLGPVAALIDVLHTDRPASLYLAGVSVSQVISNVPATILLSEYSGDWRIIAYAVNVGGFGLAVGSLANIIALRMSRDRRAWMVFHGYSLPFLLVAALLVYLWLFPR